MPPFDPSMPTASGGPVMGSADYGTGSDEAYGDAALPRRERLKRFLFRHLSQTSTVVGIVGSVTVLGGWAIAPTKITAISTIVSLFSGITLVYIQEPPREPHRNNPLPDPGEERRDVPVARSEGSHAGIDLRPRYRPDPAPQPRPEDFGGA